MAVKPGIEPAVMMKDVPLVGATLAISVLALLALKLPEKPASLTDNVADWPAAVNDSDDGEATMSGCGVDVGAVPTFVGLDVGAVVGVDVAGGGVIPTFVGTDVGVAVGAGFGAVVGAVVGVDVGEVVGVPGGAGAAGAAVGTGVGLIGADAADVVVGKGAGAANVAALGEGAGAPTAAALGLGEPLEPPPHAWSATATREHDAAKTYCSIFT